MDSKALWSRLSERSSRLYSSDVRELVKYASSTDVLSLAAGLPSPDFFPIDRIQEAYQVVLSESGKIALQYGQSEGYVPLREYLSTRMRAFEIECSYEDIFITSGSQQAFDLIAKVLIDPGDSIAVESPTYLGAIQLFSAYQANFVSIGCDDNGISIDQLRNILDDQQIKMVYLNPNFQNPSGRTMSLDRRVQLAELAGERGLVIIEDDSYGELRYEGEHIPSIKSLDPMGLVVHLGTFSKILVPGLRVGWVIASNPLRDKLILAKQATDLFTSVLDQMILCEVCSGGFLDQHIHQLISVYGERRDVMLIALDKNLPSSVYRSNPEGGIFVFLVLPSGVDTKKMLGEAIEAGVTYAPGSQFHADGLGHNTMRLNFSFPKPDQILAGVERLASLLRKHL